MLVHCVAGVSRSAALVLAYLIRLIMISHHAFIQVITRYYCDLSSAWRHVKTIRPWVRPNDNFLQQLVQWETDWACLGLRQQQCSDKISAHQPDTSGRTRGSDSSLWAVEEN